MAELNKDSTIGNTPFNLPILLLMYVDSCVEYISFFRKKTDPQPQDIQIMKAHIEKIYNVIYGSVQVTCKPEEIKYFEGLLYSDDIKDIISAYRWISVYLYNKKLLRFDSKKQLHSWNIVERNKQILEGDDDY